jgi:hypothetical protein
MGGFETEAVLLDDAGGEFCVVVCTPSPELSTMFRAISANGFGASLPKLFFAWEFAVTAGLETGGCTGLAGWDTTADAKVTR